MSGGNAQPASTVVAGVWQQPCSILLMRMLPTSHGLTRGMWLQLDMEGLYEQEGNAPVQLLQKALSDQATGADPNPSRDSMAGVVWTPSMRRMYTLTDRYALVASLGSMVCPTYVASGTPEAV